MLYTEEKKYLKTINFEKKLEIISDNLKNKKVVIYGAGKLFETAVKCYNFSGLNIIGISDKRFSEFDKKEILGYKIVEPNFINDISVDCILIATKRYETLLEQFKVKYPDKLILPLFPAPCESALERRYIKQNIKITQHSLHCKHRKKYPKITVKCFELYNKLCLRLKKIIIPQIEFTITTKCSLRCKDCTNYIPQILPNEHCITSIDEFKLQLDNLLKAIHKLKHLILIGGEPLLVKNLEEFLEYAASKRKIERIWITTNGTIVLNEKLLNIIKKYKKKVTIWISNYSANENLSKKLKVDKILKQLKDFNIDYDYDLDLTWDYTSPIDYTQKRYCEREYFAECNHECVAVFGGKIYVCPRAGVFHLKNIYTPQKDEIIDLNIENEPVLLRDKLIKFYMQEYFSACDYCTILEDRKRGNVIPALQIED